MVLSYEFERPYRKLSEHKQRDRFSDRASQATRPTFDMRLAPMKHWGGVFQRGPVEGSEGKSRSSYKLITDPYESCTPGHDAGTREMRRAIVAVFESGGRLEATWHRAVDKRVGRRGARARRGM